jgi:hypothetical protein
MMRHTWADAHYRAATAEAVMRQLGGWQGKIPETYGADAAEKGPSRSGSSGRCWDSSGNGARRGADHADGAGRDRSAPARCCVGALHARGEPHPLTPDMEDLRRVRGATARRARSLPGR